MTRVPELITFHLRSWELKALQEPPNMKGGQRSFYDNLMSRLIPDNEGGAVIAFNDCQLGELARHMSYNDGVGGFQGRLRKAFASHFARIVGINA
jgi:hypothetical protein